MDDSSERVIKVKAYWMAASYDSATGKTYIAVGTGDSEIAWFADREHATIFRNAMVALTKGAAL